MDQRTSMGTGGLSGTALTRYLSDEMLVTSQLIIDWVFLTQKRSQFKHPAMDNE